MTPLEIPFKELVERQNPNHFKGRLISLDPGETTGFCVMYNLEVVDSGQIDTKTLPRAYKALTELLYTPMQDYPCMVVCEDYKVYAWRSKQHEWSGLHTPRLLGMIETLCILYNRPIVYQMAVEAKQFATNDKLQAWGIYPRGKKHAADAVRHAVIYSLFKTPPPPEAFF